MKQLLFFVIIIGLSACSLSDRKTDFNIEFEKIVLDNGLEVILANGQYQQIYDKWIATYDKDYSKNTINLKSGLKKCYLNSLTILRIVSIPFCVSSASLSKKGGLE